MQYLFCRRTFSGTVPDQKTLAASVAALHAAATGFAGESRAESAAESALKKKDKEEEFNQFKVL